MWFSVKLLALSLCLHSICQGTCCLFGLRYPFGDLLTFVASADSTVLAIAPRTYAPGTVRLNGAVMQYADRSSEGQTFRDRYVNLSRKCLARYSYGQNLVVLNVKMWEKYRKNILHIFILEPRIIDCIIIGLFVIIFISCLKSSLEPWGVGGPANQQIHTYLNK